MLAFSHQTGVTLAEVGFLLILFAGVWLLARSNPSLQDAYCENDRRRHRPRPRWSASDHCYSLGVILADHSYVPIPNRRTVPHIAAST